MADKGRQDLGKTDTPSNKRKQEGRECETRENMGRQGETRTRPRKGGHIIQHMHTCGETMGDKLGGKRTQELGNADAPSNTGTPPKNEHTIQHRHTCGETMGDNESNGRH